MAVVEIHAIILTLNEELHLECLASLAGKVSTVTIVDRGAAVGGSTPSFS
jgi:hypothetical protein